MSRLDCLAKPRSKMSKINYVPSKKIYKMGLLFDLVATNSCVLIPISLLPDGVDLRYFKLRFIDFTEFIIWNI